MADARAAMPKAAQRADTSDLFTQASETIGVRSTPVTEQTAQIMIRATRILRRDALSGGEIVDRVVLDHGDRHRRRVAMRGTGGLDFLLDLPEPAVLEDGDALVLQDGRLVWVEAASERLLEIRAPSEHALKRLIWHIGNRHIPAEIGADAVWIADDHVLAEMVRGLGGTVEPVIRPFRPEGGAYAGGSAQAHAHGGHHHHHAAD